MQPGAAPRVIAACLGLCGFVVAIIAGLYAGNPADEVIGWAIVALIVCQVVGMFVGMAGEAVITEHAQRAAPASIPQSGAPGYTAQPAPIDATE